MNQAFPDPQQNQAQAQSHAQQYMPNIQNIERDLTEMQPQQPRSQLQQQLANAQQQIEPNKLYPKLVNLARASSYKTPKGQWFFTKWHRAIDLFGKSNDYYDPATRLDNFAFGEESFKISDVYQYYYGETQRYPVQAFLDIYFFDTIQEQCRTYDEKQRILGKTKKFAQLAQKLYILKSLEEQLQLRIRMLEYKSHQGIQR